MNIIFYAYGGPCVNIAQHFDEVLSLTDALNVRAIRGERYIFDSVFDHLSSLGKALTRGDGDYCLFFTLNADIISLIEQRPYTSHIIVLDDLSVCPSLFSSWEQFPSTDGSQEWRPADWKRTETTVLVTTRERLVENVIAFLKREGLSFKEGK